MVVHLYITQCSLTFFGHALRLRTLYALVLGPAVASGEHGQPGVGVAMQVDHIVFARHLAPELDCEQINGLLGRNARGGVYDDGNPRPDTLVVVVGCGKGEVGGGVVGAKIASTTRRPIDLTGVSEV